jgi:hypothetical protein
MGVDINFLNLKTKFRISVIEAAVRRKTLRHYLWVAQSQLFAVQNSLL